MNDSNLHHRRRSPTQRRSRERVEAILAAAHELLVEHGTDALRVNEIASRAGVAIGSVYQYFPDKAAILRELALRFMERTRAAIAVTLEAIDTKAKGLDAADAMVQGYYGIFLDGPDTRDLWAATQSDKELQKLDVEDSRTNGQLLFERLAPLAAPGHLERLRAATFLYAHLAGATVRLAIAVDRAEGDAMVEEFRISLRRSLDELLAD